MVFEIKLYYVLDPLEHISAEENIQNVSRSSGTEDDVIGINTHKSGSILGTIHHFFNPYLNSSTPLKCIQIFIRFYLYFKFRMHLQTVNFSSIISGPNIHGLCYCEKDSKGVSTVTSTRYEHADSTYNIADHGKNIFKRKCTLLNCRGCVIEVSSPPERFEIPHKNLLRCVSNYCTKIAVLNIAAQKGLPQATYNFLSTLTSMDMIITQQQFTRVWRSILLRRAQEVQSRTTCKRVENMIPLNVPGMLVPAPLSDLLHSIGRFHSTATGVIHQTFAPEKPSTGPIEDWWTIDTEILCSWIRMIHIFKNKFVMKEAPLATDFENRPLMMTQIKVTKCGMVQCMSKTNEIGLTDGYVHMVNDPLYDPSIYAFEDCHLIVSSPVNQDSLRTEYLSSYIINEEARY